MTDNEIIKAMNYCCGNITWEDDAECTKDKCYQCALPEDRDGDTRWCRQWLIKDALDLINRQKAEIDVLQDEVVIKTNMYNDMKDQRDKEHQYCMHYITMIAKAKAEAIKEFAEKVKALFIPEDEVREEIDNLVKEMVGEYDV